MVVVVNDIDSVDGGCAGVANDDVASSWVVLGCVSRGAVCIEASAVEGVVVWVLKSMRGIVCVLFSRVVPLLSGGSVCRAAHRCSGAALVCEAVSSVLGVAWAPTSILVRIRGVETSGEAQRPSPWFDTQLSISSNWPCTLPSEYACLYFTSCSSLPSSSPDSWPSLQPFLYARFSVFFLFSISSFLPSFFPSLNTFLCAFSSSLHSSSITRYLPSSYPSE